MDSDRSGRAEGKGQRAEVKGIGKRQEEGRGKRKS
jgi:hypothetical protein